MTCFWRTIHELSAWKYESIPMAVYEDGHLTRELNLIVDRWMSDYKMLCNT